MATIKSYTDIEQSKKLAEILPIESADMYYTLSEDNSMYMIGFGKPHKNLLDKKQICWSLAALLNALPNGIVMNKDSQNGRYHFSSTHIGTYVIADNPIDACVAMIEKMNELNLL